MSTQPTTQSNRRDFIKNSSAGVLAAGLGGTLNAEGASAQEVQPDDEKDIQWHYPHKKCEPIGPMDLILQLEEGQKLADESLIKYGTVEPAEGGSGSTTTA